MKFADWQKEERKKREDEIATPFLGRENELAELEAFLRDQTFRVFGLYGVPMIGKTTLVREFLKTATDYQVLTIRFQNPENPEDTLNKAFDRERYQFANLNPQLIVLENFEEVLQWKGDHNQLHQIKYIKVREFLEEKVRLPFVKLILESRFQIKVDFLPNNIYVKLKNTQLGEIDREKLFVELNQYYRNKTVSYEVFEKLCEKFDDHIWLIIMAMESDWEFQDVLEAVQRPQSITQRLWDKLQNIINRLDSSQRTLLCAFARVNPLSKADLEKHLKTLSIFRKQNAFDDALWSLRKKLLTVYNVPAKSYEINPFLREVCFTFLQYQREMKTIDALPYFAKFQKPKYDPIQQAQEKGDYSTFFKLLKEKRTAGEYKKVIEVLLEDYWVNPKKVVVLNEIGITHRHQKKYEESLNALTEALEIEPDNVKVLTELAITYKEQKKYDEAIEVLTRALKIEPKDVKMLTELVIIYKEQKKYDEAITILTQALKIKPNDVKLLNELASIYKEQRKYTDAMAILKKGLKLSPKDRYFKHSLNSIQDLPEKIEVKLLHNEEVLNQKERLLEQQKDSLGDLNNVKITIDENVNTKVRLVKFWICSYFVFAWTLTIIVGRIVGWNVFEEFTFYIGFGFTILGFLYLVISNEEWNLTKYMGKLRKKYYVEECKKMSYSDEKVNSLYENISHLEEEIRELQVEQRRFFGDL